MYHMLVILNLKLCIYLDAIILAASLLSCVSVEIKILFCPFLFSSLGFCNRYIVQLLNLAIPALAAPALHNSGFAVSCFIF